MNCPACNTKARKSASGIFRCPRHGPLRNLQQKAPAP